MEHARLLLTYSILCLLCSGCGDIDEEYEFKSVKMGSGSLEIRHLGAFGFGAHELRFYWREDDREELLAQTEICNDGASLGENNLEVVNLDNGRWELILKGQEQEDEHWVVETGGGDVRIVKKSASD